MADRLNLGGSGESFEQTVARMQRASQTSDELNRKSEQLRQSEERTAGTEQGSRQARNELASATQELSSALSDNIGLIGRETEMLAANTAVLREQLDLRRAIASTPFAAGGGRGGGGGRGPVIAAGGAFEEDPNAAARLAQARQQYEAAIAQQERARTAVSEARGSKAPAETLAPLIATRDESNQAARVARREVAAAETNVAASEQAARSRQAANVEQQRINAELAAQAQAQAEATAATERAAQLAAEEVAISRRGGQLALPGVAGAAYGAQGRVAAEAARGPGPIAGDRPLFAQTVAESAALSPLHGTTRGGAASSVEAPTEKVAAYRAELARTSRELEGLASSQREANVLFQESAAMYAGSSNALSRHGALTTEFIQAFARGQVTMREFGEQMVSTIGKFGGWAVAGAAVYGVFKVFEDLKKGAEESQAAVQELGRFIPGLGGPAGGGTSQVKAAQNTVRDIAVQFNVPMADVVEAMGVTARVFHNLADAGEAARAVLAAEKLDQVPQATGTRLLLGVSQSLGFQHGSQVTGVVNSLNALQAGYGARVAQTLPAVAVAAPAALAAGTSVPTLEALAGLGVRAGLPGNQVGTALLRSMGTFAYTPSAQQTFARYGIQPTLGNYDQLIHGVMGVIDKGKTPEGQPLTQVDLRALSTALGGPRIGQRGILPILEAEYQDPGRFAQFRRTAQRPRPYQEDLDAVLGRVNERFKSIGIALQAFGSQLAQAGLLSVINGMLDAFQFAAHTLRALASPITDALSVFNRLPSAVEDVIGVMLGFLAVRSAYNSRFGETAQAFMGRLPGMSDIYGPTSQRSAVRGQLANIENYILPEERAQAETSARNLMRARGRLAQAYDEQAAYQQANAHLGNEGVAFNQRSEGGREYMRGTAQRQDEIASADQAVARAAAQSASAQSAYAQRQADVVVLKDDQYSWEERATLLLERGYVADHEYVDLKEQQVALLRDQIELMRGGGATALGRRGGGGAAPPGEGALAGAAAATAAVSAIANDPSSLRDLQRGVEQSRVVLPAGVERPVSPVAEPHPAEAVYSMQERLRSEAASSAASQRGVLDTLGLQGLVSGAQSRFANLRGGIDAAGGIAPYAVERTQAAYARLQQYSGTAPIAGLIGTQLLGGAIGGGPGNYISSVGGAGFSGALMAQFLGQRAPLGFAAGAVLGNFQQSSTSGLASLGGGIIGGGLAGLINPGLIPLGAAAGSVIGGAAASLFGGGGSGNKQQDAAVKAIKDLHSGVDKFTLNYSDQLAQAFSGSGSSAANAQNRVSAIMQGLTAQLSLFGANSSRGRTAQQELSVAVAAAAGSFNTNPAAAQQIIQSAQQVMSGIVTRTSAIIKYGDPRNLDNVLRQAQSQIAAPAKATGTELNDQRTNLAGNRAAIAARAGGNTLPGILGQGAANILGSLGVGPAVPQAAQIDRLLKTQRSIRDQVSTLKAIMDYLHQTQRDANDQIAQLRVERGDQIITARSQIAQAQTGDPAARAGISIAADRQRLALARRTRGLSPGSRQQLIGAGMAQLMSDQQQFAQTQVDQLNATAQVAENAIPSTDPIGRANAALRGQQQVYAYMRAHTNVYGPAQLASAFAQVEAAQQALADATYQQQSELVQAQGQLAAAQAHGDPAGTAIASRKTAQRMLAIARTPAQRTSARAQIIEAGTAAQEAAIQTADLQGQIAQANDYGNTVAQANDAIGSANRQLAMAQTSQERLRAQAQLIQAHNQLQQAMADRFNAEAELSASRTVDPVRQALDRLRGAQRALSVTTGVDNRLRARTQLNQFRTQYEQAMIDQRESVIDFQFQMMQITSGQATSQLQALLRHARGMTLATRQSIQEQIRRYQLGLESPIGSSGGFDLAPGNIRLPTFYDISRGLRGGNLGGGGRTTVIHAPAQINLYMRNAGDLPKVADALDRALGSGLTARLRSGGVV